MASSSATTDTLDASILIERDGSVGIVTINRPSRLNAVTPEAGGLLESAFLELESESAIRAIVLTGAGRGFCAGADISGDTGNARSVLRDIWNPLILTMRSLQVPVIAAVNGVAAGAGVSLALASDLRVAAKSARFQLSFAKVGLMPDAGSTWLLPRIVGLGRANELALLARSLTAPEAREWGLVNQLADDGAAVADAIALARSFDGLSTSIAAAKQAFQRAVQVDLADQLDHETDTQAWLQEQPDFSEATRAFNEKRPACFADRADVAFGTFYNQFDSKDDIVEAVIGETIVGLADSVAQSPQAADPIEAVVASTRAIVQVAYNEPNLARLLVNLEQAERRFERIIRAQAGAVLERGAEAGVFVIDDHSTTLTMCMAGAFEVIHGILDGRLGPNADITCAEMILRMAGVDPQTAAQHVRGNDSS